LNHLKKLASLIIIATLTCSAQGAVLKIATLAPNGSDWMERMRRAGDEIAANTDNRVKLKFYPGGVMGDDKTVLRKMRIGQLHGGTFTSAALAKYYSDSQIYNLPLKFRSFAEVDYVRARLDERIIAGFEEAGLVTFGLTENGFAYTMSRSPIKSVADLKQRKVWIPSDDKMGLVAIRAFDVDPIPLGIGDVLTGLQTGLIDTIASSPIAAIALQWHNQVSHMTDLPIMYLFAILAVNEKAFAKIEAQDQATVRAILTRVVKEIETQTRADNIASYDALLNQGLTMVTPPPEALKIWQSKAANSVEQLVEQEIISSSILDLLEKYLNEFRSLQASNQ
jgi:TRAP-type C4-dicarboxylate transport system substrate-binding protein